MRFKNSMENFLVFWQKVIIFSRVLKLKILIVYIFKKDKSNQLNRFSTSLAAYIPLYSPGNLYLYFHFQAEAIYYILYVMYRYKCAKSYQFVHDILQLKFLEIKINI